MKLRKGGKVTSEDDMLTTKPEINNNLLTQIFEKSKNMEYYEKTVKFISRVIGAKINNIMVKGARFKKKIFIRGLQALDKKGVM